MRPATSSSAYGFEKKAWSGMSPEERAASPFPEVTKAGIIACLIGSLSDSVKITWIVFANQSRKPEPSMLPAN
jgi:hypothetical protein